jgi:hypothetical protein
VPFTLNGFPYGDFHQAVVKHEVYKPDWTEEARVRYTLDLVEILDRLLPDNTAGTISTLPLQWGNPRPADDRLAQTARNLNRVADGLAQFEQQRGRLISLCLEPEPGCVLQRGNDVVRFFERYLLPLGDEAAIRRYIRVCHDICHTAVMFEDQVQVLDAYRAAGIQVGKVQVSSAVVMPLGDLAPADQSLARSQLSAFAEDRYLHQTMIRRSSQREPVFFEDLPGALNASEALGADAAQWRIHFHVPIYLDRFGLLRTSQDQILACLDALRAQGGDVPLEVETYAWGVLPEPLQHAQLADGISQELLWLHDQLSS